MTVYSNDMLKSIDETKIVIYVNIATDTTFPPENVKQERKTYLQVQWKPHVHWNWRSN